MGASRLAQRAKASHTSVGERDEAATATTILTLLLAGCAAPAPTVPAEEPTCAGCPPQTPSAEPTTTATGELRGNDFTAELLTGKVNEPVSIKAPEKWVELPS